MTAIYKEIVFDADHLRGRLRKAGIQATVRYGAACYGDPGTSVEVPLGTPVGIIDEAVTEELAWQKRYYK